MSLSAIARLIVSRIDSVAANVQDSRSFRIIGIHTLAIAMNANLATALMVQYVKLCKALSGKQSAECFDYEEIRLLGRYWK